jgi:hypothetical protein
MAKRKRTVTVPIRSANIPTSMGSIAKLKKFKFPRRSDGPGSKSVYAVGGGSPDTKRSRH